MKKIITLSLLIIVCIAAPLTTYAQEETFKVTEESYQARITELKNYDCFEGQTCTDFTLELLTDEREGEEVSITITPEEQQVMEVKGYKVGDTVILISTTLGEETTYFITDHVRSNPILLLVITFILIVIIVGKVKGVQSLLGLALSILVLFAFVLPAILNGWNPLLIGIVGSLAIAIPSIYLSHGFHKKSTIALIGTIISMVIVFALTILFTNLMKLTGFGSEEAMFLQGEGFSLNMKGILLASVVFGGIGILDDVTVSQVSIVHELNDTNPELLPAKLYSKAMNVGQDHISSMVNTLFLAYASSSLPLVLLLRQQETRFQEIINNEIIAEEILRTIIGSIGLVLAVPITTGLAVYFLKRTNIKASSFMKNKGRT